MKAVDDRLSEKDAPGARNPNRSALNSPASSNQRRIKSICIALFIMVAAAYLPSLKNGFVNYDDNLYVTANAHVQKGLTPGNVAWAFCASDACNWHPMTWLSHILDCQIFGLDAWGHHLTSLVLHALNAVLVFMVMQMMTGATGRSAFVAALFGLHPLHVESVAWVAERKDVLSTFFWLLAMLAYVRYVQESKVHPPLPKATEDRGSKFKVYYCLALLCFALGLMAKPMVVTLPFALLLMDYWPLQRICDLRFTIYEPNLKAETSSEANAVTSARVGRKKSQIGPLILEKVPFFILSAAASLVTFFVQKSGGATAIIAIPFGARLENALVSYGRYLEKLIYPVNLSVAYPHPGYWPVGTVILAGLLLLGISVFALFIRSRSPFVLAGWLWFVGTLVPVIGLVQVGEQAMADRYSYIPSIGFFVIVVWGTCDLALSSRGPLWAMPAAGVVVAVILAGLTYRQIGYWRDSGALFRHAIALTENNSAAHNNLGSFLLEKKQVDAAVKEYLQAIQANTSNANAYYNLGLALQGEGRLDDAIEQYQKAITKRPRYFDALNNLAMALYQKGRSAEAISNLQYVINLKPDYVGARCNLGYILLNQGRLEEALAQFEEAVRMDPDNLVAHQNLASIYAKQGKAEQAAYHYQETLRLSESSSREQNGPLN